MRNRTVPHHECDSRHPFSQDVLAATWFQVLAAAVAFNSLVFLGLTVAKLIPWPQQFHPDWVSERLERIGVIMGVEESKSQIRKREQTKVSFGAQRTANESFEAIRNAIIIRDIPWAIAVLGISIGLLSVVELILFGRDSVDVIYQIPMSVIWLILGIGLGRSTVSATARSWIWIAVVVIEVGVLAILANAGSDESAFNSSTILLAIYAPFTMRWRPAIIGGIGLVIIYCVEMASYGIEDARWFLAGPIAVGGSLILLKLRLITVAALADERVALKQGANRDQVSGALTLRGLQPLVPSIASCANRMQEPVWVTVLRLDNFTDLGDDYGLSYTDELIAASADVARRSSNLGDLLARNSEDSLMIVGFGDESSHRHVRDQLAEDLPAMKLTLGKGRVNFSIGLASGDPLVTTFESLILDAENSLISIA